MQASILVSLARILGKFMRGSVLEDTNHKPLDWVHQGHHHESKSSCSQPRSRPRPDKDGYCLSSRTSIVSEREHGPVYVKKNSRVTCFLKCSDLTPRNFICELRYTVLLILKGQRKGETIISHASRNHACLRQQHERRERIPIESLYFPLLPTLPTSTPCNVCGCILQALLPC